MELRATIPEWCQVAPIWQEFWRPEFEPHQYRTSRRSDNLRSPIGHQDFHALHNIADRRLAQSCVNSVLHLVRQETRGTGETEDRGRLESIIEGDLRLFV